MACGGGATIAAPVLTGALPLKNTRRIYKM